MLVQSATQLGTELVQYQLGLGRKLLAGVLAGTCLTSQAPAAPYLAPQYPTRRALPPPQTQTEQQLKRAESLGGGRGLQFAWAEAGLGYRHLALQAISGKALLGSASANATQPAVQAEAAAGVRLIFLTAGAQLRTIRSSDWTLWSVGGIAGLHWPYGDFEPSAHIAVGYAWMRDLDTTTAEVDGLHWGFGGQLRWYLMPEISVGVRGDLEMFALGRDANGQAPLSSPDSSSASALGVAAGASALLGVHY